MEIANGKRVFETLAPLLQSVFLADFDSLTAGYFPNTAAPASSIVSGIFFIVCHYSYKLQFGLESRPKLCKIDEPEL